jgi:hypothetical protein
MREDYQAFEGFIMIVAAVLFFSSQFPSSSQDMTFLSQFIAWLFRYLFPFRFRLMNRTYQVIQSIFASALFRSSSFYLCWPSWFILSSTQSLILSLISTLWISSYF